MNFNTCHEIVSYLGCTGFGGKLQPLNFPILRGFRRIEAAGEPIYWDFFEFLIEKETIKLVSVCG
jgi:hypothetical protein